MISTFFLAMGRLLSMLGPFMTTCQDPREKGRLSWPRAARPEGLALRPAGPRVQKRGSWAVPRANRNCPGGEDSGDHRPLRQPRRRPGVGRVARGRARKDVVREVGASKGRGSPSELEIGKRRLRLRLERCSMDTVQTMGYEANQLDLEAAFFLQNLLQKMHRGVGVAIEGFLGGEARQGERELATDHVKTTTG